MTRPYRKRALLADLHAEQKPGECCLCGERVVQGKGKRVRVCASEDCRTTYRRLYQNTFRAFVRAEMKSTQCQP